MHSDIFFCVLYILFYLILTNHIVEKLIILLFVSWQSPLPHGTRECYTNFRISSSGNFKGTRRQPLLFWTFPLHVSDHCIWKPAHHPSCQPRLPPSHPHVHLPLQPVLCRHLCHFHHHPKVAVEHPEPEQSYSLWRLHHPDVFFHALCRVGYLSPDSDGLWLLHGHLSPPELHSHHELSALWIAGPGILDDECPEFLATKLTDVVAVLL